MTGADMYDILDKFKSDVRREVAHDMKNGINYIDPVRYFFSYQYQDIFLI